MFQTYTGDKKSGISESEDLQAVRLLEKQRLQIKYKNAHLDACEL